MGWRWRNAIKGERKIPHNVGECIWQFSYFKRTFINSSLIINDDQWFGGWRNFDNSSGNNLLNSLNLSNNSKVSPLSLGSYLRLNNFSKFKKPTHVPHNRNISYYQFIICLDLSDNFSCSQGIVLLECQNF